MKARSRSSGTRLWSVRLGVTALAVLALAATGHAEEAAKVDSGDNAWMLTSAALVLIISGEWGLLKVQVLAVTGGLRVNEDDEFTGLDLSQHSENAYILGGASAGSSFGGMHSTHAQRVTA
jgi:hypothetical protein